MDRFSPSDYGLEQTREDLLRPERVPDQPGEAPNSVAPRLDPLQEIALLRDRSKAKVIYRGAGASHSDDVPKRSRERQHDRHPSRPVRSREGQDRLPRRLPRASHPIREIGLKLRPEERNLMQELGKFRVIAMRDAAELLYEGRESAVRADARYLQEQGFVEVHSLNARRDGQDGRAERFEALTLTRRGRDLIRKSGELSADQQIYSGLVKPREAEHDSQIFRAYRKELERIEREGGRNVRVRLDFEIKAHVNRAMYLGRKAEPERDADQVKAEVAASMNLRTDRGSVVVPDLRIEYDVPNGGSAHVDVEVATAAYRHAQIASKARAGMRIYASHRDIGRLGGCIQDDHDIMSEILSL